MSDVGTLVTDAEVADFVKNHSAAGKFSMTEALIIRGVEAKIRRAIGEAFVQTVYTDEAYSVDWEKQSGQFVTVENSRLILKHGPVSSFGALKLVTSRDAVTGAPSATYTIPRNAYFVDMDNGVIQIIDPALIDPNALYPGGLFPAGVGNLLATYTAWSSQPPADLKLLTLKIIARINGTQRAGRWGQSSTASPDGSTTNYLDMSFTSDEEGDLDPFRTGFYA